MHRPHRHLDRERHQQREENQDLLGHRQRHLLPGQDIERTAGHEIQIDHRDQHQQRTHQRVQEELDRRIYPVGAAPDADDDEHRNQRGFEEDVEQQAVERAEHADHQAGQDQEGAHVLRDPLLNHPPAGYHHQHRDERGQRQEPQRQAIDAQRVADAETVDPGRVFDELHAVERIVEMHHQRQRRREADDGADQRQPARQLWIIVAADCQDEQTESDRQPDRKAEKRES
jgi:hypothetical protein